MKTSYLNDKGDIKLKIIKLEQPNCTPCKYVSNFLDDKNVKYEAIDVTENPDVAADFSVMGVPVTILLDENNVEVSRSVGYKPNELEAIISQL